MKRINSIFFLAITFFVMSCQSDFDNIKIENLPLDNDQQLAVQGLGQIEKAIVTDWASATTNLLTGVTTFTSDVSDANLSQAQGLWKLSRDPWESNESFGFGPVGTDNIDASSDDWPFDIAAFNAILASSQTLNATFISQMTTTTKGFHAIEFVLFGQDGNKKAADFTVRELQLLQLLSSDLNTQSQKLKTWWTPNVSNSFYDAFITAGAGSTLYPTTQAALGDVLGAMVDITDELPNSKIQTPLTTQSSAYLESRFADYSYYDYLNNLKGVYAVYVGQYGSVTTQKNISSLVASANAAVDGKVITQFKLCIALMQLVQPTSMNQAIISDKAQLQEIVSEIQKLNKLLDGEVREVLDL